MRHGRRVCIQLSLSCHSARPPMCAFALQPRPQTQVAPTWLMAFRFLAFVGASPSVRMHCAMSATSAAAMAAASGASWNRPGVHSFTFLSVVCRGDGRGTDQGWPIADTAQHGGAG